jgi:hypothetical protein
MGEQPVIKKKRVQRVHLTTYYRGTHPNGFDSSKFSVPKTWLQAYLKDQSIDDFLLEYTYDDSERIREKAIEDNVFRR